MSMDRQQDLEPKDDVSRGAHESEARSEGTLEAEGRKAGIGLTSEGSDIPPRSILPYAKPQKADGGSSDQKPRHRYAFLRERPLHPNPHCGILYDGTVCRSTRTLTESSSWDPSVRSAGQNGGGGPVPRPLSAMKGSSSASGNLDRTPRTQLTSFGSSGSAPVHREQPWRLENQNASIDRARLPRLPQSSSRDKLANEEKPSHMSSGSGHPEGAKPRTSTSHLPQAHNNAVIINNSSNNNKLTDHASTPSRHGSPEKEKHGRVIDASPSKRSGKTFPATANVQLFHGKEIPGESRTLNRDVGSGVRTSSLAMAVPSSSAASGRGTSSKNRDHGGRVGTDVLATHSAPY